MEKDNGTVFMILALIIALISFGFTVGKVTTVNSSETH